MSDVLRVLNELESRNSPKVKSARKIIQLTKLHDLFSECKLYGQPAFIIASSVTIC